jgi:hypothetical protein
MRGVDTAFSLIYEETERKDEKRDANRAAGKRSPFGLDDVARNAAGVPRGDMFLDVSCLKWL